jgi:hypothetical protein
MSEAERRKPGPKPSGREPLPIVWPIKGTREWREWLSELAMAYGTTPTAMLDEWAKAAAKKIKFKPPPDRTGGG